MVRKAIHRAGFRIGLHRDFVLMLSRDGLAKQFETLVQAEIAKHERHIVETEKRLNEFQRDINQAVKNILDFGCRFTQDIKSLDDADKCHEERLKEHQNLYEAKFRKLEKLSEKVVQEGNLKFSAIDLRLLDIQYCKEDIKDLSEKIKAQDLEFKKRIIDLETLIYITKKDVLQLVDKAIRDLCEQWNSSEEKLQQDIGIATVDAEGIKKELEVYKKSVFIIEKKLENIYTLIDRINKREEK
jgi:hypothetical protein